LSATAPHQKFERGIALGLNCFSKIESSTKEIFEFYAAFGLRVAIFHDHGGLQ
jgi:hypothetical protein